MYLKSREAQMTSQIGVMSHKTDTKLKVKEVKPLSHHIRIYFSSANSVDPFQIASKEVW